MFFYLDGQFLLRVLYSVYCHKLQYLKSVKKETIRAGHALFFSWKMREMKDKDSEKIKESG